MIRKAIQSVIGRGPHLLHEPLIGTNEYNNVASVLNTGHLAAGEWVTLFENRFKTIIGAKHAIAVMNGTSGLHAAITVLPKLAEYRLPALTFVATANAVAYGNNKIRFVEHNAYCDIPVDILGHPHFNIGAPLRDSAQSLGSKFHGKYVGSTGTCVFSFNQNKIITTGGGGMITTDDDTVAENIRHLITTARVQHKWETAHNAVAWNYRMSDLSAAVGVAQLSNLHDIVKAKRALAKRYIEVMMNTKGVDPIVEPENCESNYWLNAIRLKEPAMMEPLLEELHEHGIKARRMWTPIHMLPMYQDCDHAPLEQTEDYYNRVICLPSSPKLGMKFL